MKNFLKKLKPIRYVIEYAFVKTIYLFIRLLPLKCVFILADFIGFFLYLAPHPRKLIKANLKIAFPDKKSWEIHKIARKNASNIVLSILEFFWFINRHHKLNNLLYMDPKIQPMIDKCVKNKTGLIWVTPHLGNWEVARIAVSNSQDIPMAVVARKLNNPYLNKLINYGRMADGSRVIPAKGAVKGMIKALKDGCMVATLVDQNTRARDGGIFVNFFGLPVTTSRAPALFGRKFKAILAVGGAIRKGYKYETFVEELPKKPKDYQSDEELIQDIISKTEDFICQYPDQYLWMYERWRYIPEDLDEEKKKRYPYYASEVTPRFYLDRGPKPETQTK